MEVQLSRRILIRQGAAQVLEAVLFEEPPDFNGVGGRGFCSGQPTLHFGAKIVKGQELIGSVRTCEGSRNFSQRS